MFTKFCGPSLPRTTLKVCGRGWWFKVTLVFCFWSKTGILSLTSELDQAEQYGPTKANLGHSKQIRVNKDQI